MSAWHWYRGHGLLMRSAIELPEFRPAGDGGADLTIRMAESAPALPAPERGREATFLATRDGAVMERRGVGAITVRDGREIALWPAPGSRPGQLRLFLVGSGIGMVFHQRGQLVLHGAAVRHRAGVSVILGPSGAGKSTLSAHLGAAGFAVLADDLLAMGERGEWFVTWPGSQVSKLWEDALGTLGIGADPAKRIDGRDGKFFVQHPGLADDGEVTVAEVIVLGAQAEAPVLRPLGGLAALSALAENAFRPEFVPLLERQAEHFRLSARMLERVKVLRLDRPRDLTALPATVDLLRRHWGEGG